MVVACTVEAEERDPRRQRHRRTRQRIRTAAAACKCATRNVQHSHSTCSTQRAARNVQSATCKNCGASQAAACISMTDAAAASMYALAPALAGRHARNHLHIRANSNEREMRTVVMLGIPAVCVQVNQARHLFGRPMPCLSTHASRVAWQAAPPQQAERRWRRQNPKAPRMERQGGTVGSQCEQRSVKPRAFLSSTSVRRNSTPCAARSVAPSARCGRWAHSPKGTW